MVYLLLVVCVVMGVMLGDARSRLKRLDALLRDMGDRLSTLERGKALADSVERRHAQAETSLERPARASALDRPAARTASEPVAERATPPAKIVRTPEPKLVEAPARVETPRPEPVIAEFRLPKMALSFEQLVGGKLPIWVGGIALVLSAFFLVRYSIEQGLLGPRVRTIMAAVFGIVLLAASEAARRIPRFADDRRVAQSLAGAGIASLYGTFYMASELYGLIGPGLAFGLMAAITAIALFLSLRHGPPTAIMGLVGGFVAPFMAAPSGNLVPLLVYLGLLIAGLFAVAIHRGWMWLALAATGGGIAWTLGILFAGLAGIGPSLGLFIVVVAIAATMMLPRTGKADSRLRLLPMVAGFIQLALFAPAIDFGVTGWGLYGLLSAASLWLGWRDEKLMPAALAALGLVLILLFAGFMQDKPSAVWAAFGATALFAVPGHVFARRDGATDRNWTLLALAGGAGPLMVAWLAPVGPDATSLTWAMLFWAAAAAAAFLSWRARDEGSQTIKSDLALVGGAALAAGLAMIALWLRVDDNWMPVAVLGVMLSLSAWARRVQDRSLFDLSMALAMLGLVVLTALAILDDAFLMAVFADGAIPGAETIAAWLELPAAMLAAASGFHHGRKGADPLRWVTLLLLAATLTALVPYDWHPVMLAGLALGIVATGDRVPLPRQAREGVIVLALILLAVRLVPFAGILAQSLAGFTLHYGELPAPSSLIVALGLPALLLGGCAWWLRAEAKGWPYRLSVAGAGAAGIAILYALAKQPLAIATEAQFVAHGFAERAFITHALFALAALIAWRGGDAMRRPAMAVAAIALFRFGWFDLLMLNPVLVKQHVGSLPVLNVAVIHVAAVAGWLWLAAREGVEERFRQPLRLSSLAVVIGALALLVRQASQGPFLNAFEVPRNENYSYSIAFLLLALVWLWRGIAGSAKWLRIAGLGLLTLVTLKVFLVDAAALEGLLRVLSFMGLGVALIGIGWVYSRVLGREGSAVNEPSAPAPETPPPPAAQATGSSSTASG